MYYFRTPIIELTQKHSCYGLVFQLNAVTPDVRGLGPEQLQCPIRKSPNIGHGYDRHYADSENLPELF